MLRELIDLVEPHKNEHQDLYKYLMITWSSCKYDSTLYACNVTGMTMLQKHLVNFDEQDLRLYEKEMAEIKKEPEFWDLYLTEEPITKKIKEHWEDIRQEILNFEKDYSRFFVDYPKFKIVDEETNQKIKMYENNWKVSAFTKFDESYKEIERVNKKLGESLNKLIERYLKKCLPTVESLIKPYENQGILANCFASIISPGTNIKPHNGYSQDYMRIHLCLIEDINCKITVGNTTRSWKNGEILAFKDGGPYKHSVRHDGVRDRYIFSFDLSLKYLENYIPELKNYA